MQVNQDPNNIWTVYIPGGELCTDSQIIESTPESSDDEGVLAEEDCRLYLCPSQQSASLVEVEYEASSSTEADGTKIAEAEGEDITTTETSPQSTLREDGSTCHATAAVGASRQDCGTSDIEQPSRTICKEYHQGTCKYGVDGRNCKFSHPVACKKLLKYGQWGVKGCTKGEECKYFHPVCRKSVTQNFCSRGSLCRYQHPKSWQRIVGDVSQLKK